MIRFPVRLAGRQVVSHLVNLLNQKKIRGKCEGWDTPHVLGWLRRVGFPRFRGRDRTIIHHRWLQCGDSGLLRESEAECQSSRVSQRGSESARVLCCEQQAVSVQSPRPLLPPARRSPRPAADQFNVSTEVADDRRSCRSSCPCWLST
jgi:hypothetical protein